MTEEEKVIISIPDILKDCLFIIVGKKQKVPFEKKWQSDNNYAIDDQKLLTALKNGYNYGVMPSGNVCIFDADEYNQLQELGVLEPFDDTFTVKSGNVEGDHFHYYFETDEEIGNKKIVLFHPETGKHLGEIYPPNCPAMCVGAGSVHPSGKPYTIFKDHSLKFIPSKDIKAILEKCKKKEPEQEQPKTKEVDWSKHEGSRDTLTDKTGLRIEDIGYPSGKVVINGDEIQGSHPIHGSTTGMNYSINTAKNLFHCWRCGTGGDPLVFIAVKEGLIRCEDAEEGVLNDPEIMKSLNEVIKSGKKYNKIYAENLKKAEEEERRLYNENKRQEEERKRIEEKSISEEEFKSIDDRPDIKELKFKINVPEDHFISKYVKHHLDKTDAYPDYHYAAALTLLSIAADRKVIIPLKQGDIYTNLWIMNLGRSSFSRKSTALRTVKYVVGAFGAFHELPGMFSTEGLIESFDDNSHGHLIKDECAQILGSINKKQYMSDVRDVLCELYECGDIKRKLRTSKKNVKSEYEIKDSYPVFLFATTPDNFFDNSTKLDITSGWLIRFLYVFPRYPKKTKGLEIGTEQGKISLNNIGNDFNNIAGNVAAFDQIEMIPSNKGLDEFNEWFISRQEELENDEEERSLHIQVFSRILINALKIAALLTLGDKSCENEFKSLGVSQDIKIEDIEQIKDPKPKIIIPDKYMQEATRLIDEYFLPIACDIIDDVTARENENIQGRIIQVIKESPGCKITRSQLIKKMRITSKILDEHINTLEEGDVISYFVDKSKPKYTLFYCLNKGKSNNKSIFDF